jgi:hypothetical protein
MTEKDEVAVLGENGNLPRLNKLVDGIEKLIADRKGKLPVPTLHLYFGFHENRVVIPPDDKSTLKERVKARMDKRQQDQLYGAEGTRRFKNWKE